MRRNRIILLLLIILSVLLVSNYGGSIAYSMFYFSLGIPAASLIYSFYVYFRFKLYQSTSGKTVVKGETADYSFQLANEDLISFTSLRVNFFQDRSRVLELDEEKEYCLLPKQKIDRKTRITCEYRGEYYIGVESVVITDFLYLFQIKYRIKNKLLMQVLPRVMELDQFPLMYPDLNHSMHFLSPQGEEEPDHELRNYVSGDSIRRIHWRGSAKKNELMTKKYRRVPEPRLHIFADYSHIAGDELKRTVIEDKILESLLAVVRFYLNKKIYCKVYSQQTKDSFFAVYNEEQFDVFYHKCSKVQFNEQVPIEDSLQVFKQQAVMQDSFLIITHKLTVRLFQAVIYLTELGQDGAIIFISDIIEEDAQKILNLMEESNLRILKITRHQEVRDRLSSIK